MEMEVNEEEDQLNFTTSTNTNNIYYNMLQGSYDFIEDVVRVILRCLGFEEENSSNSSQPCRTSASAPVTNTTDAAATGTTTTTPDFGGSGGGGGDDSGEVADSGGQESSPDFGGGGGDDDAGTVADPPGPDTPSVGAGRIATTAAIKKPPRPAISTGRGGQIH